MSGSNDCDKVHPVSRQHEASGTETTFNRVVHLILEAYVMDHFNHRVAVRFTDTDARERIYLGGDAKQGYKVILGSPPEPVHKHRDHRIEFKSARRGVLKRKNQADTADITPRSVEYRREHWPTEFLELRQGVYTSQNDFEAAKTKDGGEDEDLHVNRVLVRWDFGQERILCCLIDGEEVDAEDIHESPAEPCRTEQANAGVSRPLANF